MTNLVAHGGSADRRNPPEPVFVLAPPCTFSWVLCAMLGQHDDAYALPELHLFRTESVGEWLDLCRTESFEMDHGLLRVVAELYFGQQTERTVIAARGWLHRRAHITTGLLFEDLTERVKPRVAIEKSPSHVYSMDILRRIWEMFPQARFVHLTSHPRSYCEIVVQALDRSGREREPGPSDWLAQLASYPLDDAGPPLTSQPDPQGGWLALHRNICAFLESVPDDQKRRIKGEDVLRGEEECLTSFAAWLGLRTDPPTIDQMRYPQRSPYARQGPASARLGSDAFIFGGCRCPAEWRRPQDLDGPVGWRADGADLATAVKQLAREFDYQ
jgi:hypothetical protein